MDETPPATSDCLQTVDTSTADWLPQGWVPNREAARRLGVSLETLTAVNWKWRPWVRDHKRCVRHPVTGGRCNIYSVAQIERIIEARAAASKLAIPEGFVDQEGAARMFGLSRAGWKGWIRLGKVRIPGQLVSSPVGGKQKLYAIADLERLREELFGEDRLYKRGSDGIYHVPAGLMRREEACERFGVSMPIWERWEREGKITCGMQVPGGPKLYKVEDIERLLDEYGKYCPPYPDPDRPGVYRVPLSGRDIKRREAIVDAESLPLIEGGTCSFSQTGEFRHVAFHSADGRNVPLRRLVLGIGETNRQVGHRNGDALDCRRENLVIRTVTQRTRNARKMKAIRGQPCTSRFKGVFWETWTKRWRARITVDGKCRWLGRFRDEIAAAVAYDDAASLWFGEHARLNFPDGVDAWLEKFNSELGEERREAA